MQKSVEDFIQKYKLQTNETTRYMDLVSEIGELGKEILKSTNYGKNDFTNNMSIADEIGDCVFSLLALCSELNIDAHEALNTSLAKYESRFSKTHDIGSSE